MLRFLKRLSPAFLLKFDRHLLLNHPQIWATKIHFLAYFGLLWTLLVSLRALTLNISLHSVPDPELQFSLLFIPLVIGAGFWAFKVYLFRPERHFGTYSGRSDFGNQMIYLFGIGLLALAPFIYGNLLVHKIDQEISLVEFQHDMDALTIGEYYMSGHWDYMNQGYFYHNNYYNIHPEKMSALRSQFAEASLETHHAFIQNYIEVWEKYSGIEFPYSPTKVWEGQNLDNSAFYDKHVFGKLDLRVEKNFSILEQVKVGKGFAFSNRKSLNGIFSMILFVAFAFIVFVKTQWKQFLFGLVLSIAGAVAVALLMQMTDHFMHLSFVQEERVALIFGVAFFSLTFIQVYFGKNTRLMTQWKSIALTAVAGVMPILMTWGTDFVLRREFHIHQNNSEITFRLLCIFGICMLIWNVVLRERFRKLQSQPTRN